jgi:hypothetical protein
MNEQMLRELRQARRENKRLIGRLIPQALGGDDEAITRLDLLLPGDRFSCFPPFEAPRKTFPYTRACLGRDLAKIRHPRAREVLVDAWSHCHLTTVGSLGGVLETVAAFAAVRPNDPHIPLLAQRTTVWRGWLSGSPGFGMSWTVDRERARWFAEVYRLRRLKGDVGEPRVSERAVSPDEVLAVVGPDEGRSGEAEIVLFPDRADDEPFR